MAQYLHLNIYKKSFDFLVKLTQLTSNFQRDFRFTIGEKLNSTTIGFIILIYKANSAKDYERVDYIVKLLDELQKITVLTRLATELRNIPRERYMELALMLEDIEKQLNGWKSHTIKEAEKGGTAEKDTPVAGGTAFSENTTPDKNSSPEETATV